MKSWIAVLGAVTLIACSSDRAPFSDVQSATTSCGLRVEPKPGFKLVEFSSRDNNEIPPGQRLFGVVSESPGGPMPASAAEVFDTAAISGVGAADLEVAWSEARNIAAGEGSGPILRSLRSSIDGCEIAVSVQHVAAGGFTEEGAGRKWYVGILERPVTPDTSDDRQA